MAYHVLLLNNEFSATKRKKEQPTIPRPKTTNLVIFFSPNIKLYIKTIKSIVSRIKKIVNKNLVFYVNIEKILCGFL